jgi:HK97 family phage major capsid protein
LTIADFEGVIGLLPAFADGPEACWVCHKTFYSTVMQALMAAQGGVTMLETSNPPGGQARGGRPMFLGYPVEFAQVMPSTTAVSTVPCLLGNFAMAAMLGDRQQPEIAFSEHASVGGQNVFERNQIAIRGTERLDINVHDVGFVSVNPRAASPGPVVGLYMHS